MQIVEAATVGRIFDACIVGSGAGGSVVASELVAAGWDVALVEQGDYVTPGTFLHDLIPGFETARARTIDGTWSDDGYPWSACAVGGGTAFYAGFAWRLREVDFDASAHTVDDAFDPRWPLFYPELRPHYDWIEATLGVSRDTGDPMLPPAAAPVMDAHRLSQRGRYISAAARSLGLRPFATPLAIASAKFRGYPRCDELTSCTDYVCPSGAKGDVVVRILRPLLEAPNLSLMTRSKAVSLKTDGHGEVRELACVDLNSRRTERIRSKVFVIAANAVQTAALLLRSPSKEEPTGLGNSYNLVGRGLCFKVGQYVRGTLHGRLSDHRVDRLGGRHGSVAVSDFYLDDRCPTGMGGMIYDVGPTDMADLLDDRLVRVECLLADQPMPSNRVVLDPGRKDALGLPRVVMDYRPHPVDLSRLRFLRQRAFDILKAAGADSLAAEPMDFTLGSAHMHGTCRFGDDPVTSVCDRQGRVHSTSNLYVADGSLMPFPGGVNPSLTIQALARHVALALLRKHSKR